MDKKHESETIRQQRIAREEFLELKKMQNGEIETGPKPSEVAIVPKTFSEKVSNIWYHFGKVIVVSVFIFVALVIMVAQCATRTKYDLTVVYFSYTVVPDTSTEKMADYFEKYCEDVNGDGEVNVTVVNCSCNPNTDNSAKLTKMQALIVAEPSALLYITDEKSIKYFDNIKTDKKSFFKKKNALGENFYNFCTEDGFTLPEDLSINLRDIENTQIEGEKEIKKTLNASEKLFDSIK